MLADFQASASATLVGSMPHKDRDRVIDLIIRETPEIPVWPQLAAFPAEQMMVQYLEGLPGIRSEGDRIFIQSDTPEFEQELYSFYEEFLSVEAESGSLETSRFKMGEEAGRTFFRFMELAARAPHPFKALKGQVVGPFTLLSTLKDQRDRATLYDERLQDAVVKHLAMKARWQIARLKTFGCPVIVFLDEPGLAGFGSSTFISVSEELIHRLLGEIVDAIHQADALAGIHICANTDWRLAFRSGVDIINFDAYNFMDKLALYRPDFLQFMSRGGIIAWGVVPTGDPDLVHRETARSLADRWMAGIGKFTTDEMDLKKILAQSLFTPSCGCGSLSEPTAERVVQLTRELGQIMKMDV